jgi:hypothetical protein
VPVTERIAEVIADRIETLTIYGTELTHVWEVVRAGQKFTPRHLQVVMAIDSTSEVESLSYPGNPPATCWETTYQLYLHVKPDETSLLSIDTVINQFSADVRKVLCVPQATWHNFDGLSIDANFGPQQKINGNGIDGLVIPLEIRYRTDENNPYQPRT